LILVHTSGPATSGYNSTPTSPGTIVINTVTSPTYSLGDGITLSLTGVNNYDLGNVNNPLVTDGFFRQQWHRSGALHRSPDSFRFAGERVSINAGTETPAPRS
jgi:hypothetical protein